jgi:putative DNA primase/helicase
LKGPIRSGKGTIARIAEAIVGEHNFSAQSMQDFGRPFGFETFLGKTFVSVSDARSDKKWTTSATEKILNITGEDTVKVEIKYKTAVNVRLQTKLLFMSNALPVIPDSSGALPTRFIFVKMVRSFFGQEDVELEQKLLTELPGIFNSAVRHLHNLLKREGFIQPESGKVLAERMLGLSSPINEFVRQIKPYAHPDSIWEEWNQFCEDEERPPGKQSDLWDAIGAAGYDADFDAARIMKKIRQSDGEATARDLRDCSRKFKDSSVLDAKLESMVKLGLLKVRTTTAENHLAVKVYSVAISEE